MIKILSRLYEGVTMGLNIPLATPRLAFYNTSLKFYILNALGIMASGYLLRYHVLGYNIYLYYLAIFLFTCFLFSNVFIALEKWVAIDKLFEDNEYLKNPDLDKLVKRIARFVVRVKAITPQIKPF